MDKRQSHRILSTREAADYLGLTPQTVRWHVRVKGDLAPDRYIGGRFLVFTRETLDAYLEGRDPAPSPDLELFSTREAADYLGLSADTVWYHVTRADNLEPDHEVAGRFVFTKRTLEKFKHRKD